MSMNLNVIEHEIGEIRSGKSFGCEVYCISVFLNTAEFIFFFFKLQLIDINDVLVEMNYTQL